MRGRSAHRLLQAVLAARGEGPAADTTAPERDLASMLIEARRLDHAAEGCPERARRRAHALFDTLPASLWETAARLVFDSWQQAAPAARSLGTERLRVYESGVASLDLQLGPDEEGRGAVLAVAVQGGGEALAAEIVLDGAASSALALDEYGTGSMTLPAGSREAVVVVRDADGELLRTPAVPLR